MKALKFQSGDWVDVYSELDPSVPAIVGVKCYGAGRTAWLVLTRDEARSLGSALIEAAQEVEETRA